ncbi:unnamed protein product [Aphanomyces euteiches]|uniref:FYVE-type domain-containing protein n=1 Tax=Aphanomyces euteiches TaxID=100861 RepID=A0A6G0WT84_9STRA|nr:hypothetical protein Ae201684_011829 [Aphanomyces euteiches]KAH9089191.1 hypothetical protein Ae201684P_001397 [Aphanomyces euteiches]KAH9157401.1 hypothetical protein AeRB84_000765 [Aphanomyces euteiches]
MVRQPSSPNHHLPLPRDYFQCPELSVEEEERMIQIARASCQRLIETTYSPNTDWSTISVKNGVRISKSNQLPVRDDVSSTSGSQLATPSSSNNSIVEPSAKMIRGTTTVNATIEEIALQFKVDRGHNLMKSRKDILDSMVLYNLVRPSGARPRDYVGVFWECVKSPIPFSQNRDFLYLECHEEFVTPDGRRGWGYSMHSIKLACCPPLDSLKLIRASLYNSGFVFVETPKSGELECHYFLELDAKGTTPHVVSDVMARRKLSALSHLNKVLQEQRLESETLLGDLELPLQHTKIECVLCYKRFQFFHRKHTCRKCGEVVCKSCQSTWELDLPGVGVRHICICTLCSANSRGASNSSIENAGRMREIYSPDDDNDSDGGGTMVTDISCSISQIFTPKDEIDDPTLSANRANRHPYNGHPHDSYGKPQVPVRHPQTATTSRPPPPPMLMDGDFTRSAGRPQHQHLSNNSEDDIISLGSEERFSFHSKLKKLSASTHNRLPTQSNGLATAPTAAPETQLERNESNNNHITDAPRRHSYDSCVDNLVNPATWRQQTVLPPSNQPRIEIGSNKRFL